MTGLLSWLIRVVSELESNMVSVERVSEYAELESEEATGAVMKTGGGGVKKPTHGWPDSGAITFENLQLRYRPGLPLVLNGVSFNVQAGEKVGICGRTGSGKSSLIVALWRLVEPCGGAIWLDGVDVSTIPLKTLRSAVTCIPQDPILFSGTVRDNLDPFKNHADAELWFALVTSRHESRLPRRSDRERRPGDGQGHAGRHRGAVQGADDPHDRAQDQHHHRERQSRVSRTRRARRDGRAGDDVTGREQHVREARRRDGGAEREEFEIARGGVRSRARGGAADSEDRKQAERRVERFEMKRKLQYV